MRALALLTVAALGCSAGTAAPTGRGEPIVLHGDGAQFHPGDLPVGAAPVKVVTLESGNNTIPQGLANKRLAGNVGKGTWGLGVKLKGYGSGYWVQPVGFPDLISEGELRWDIAFDLSRNAPVGPQVLQFVALDVEGNAGPVYEQDIKITSRIPAGKAVLTLEWDSAADLDLDVTTPSGKVVGGKAITTVPKGDKVDPAAPGVGVLDRDSNGSCIDDGFRQEDLVFQTSPEPGLYTARVNMFAGCGAPSARFSLVLRVDGVEVKRSEGFLVTQLDANGGKGPGLYVMQFSF